MRSLLKSVSLGVWLAFGVGLMLGGVLTGCSEIEDLDNFDVEIVQETAIPAASALELVLGDFPTLDAFTRFDLSENATFQNTEYSPNDVDSVVLEELTFTVVEPEGQDLSFFGEVIFFVEAEGLERKEIARQDTFPQGQGSVSFETTNDDLKPYLLAKEANITVEINDTARPEQETTIEVKAVFDVDVNVL